MNVELCVIHRWIGDRVCLLGKRVGAADWHSSFVVQIVGPLMVRRAISRASEVGLGTPAEASRPSISCMEEPAYAEVQECQWRGEWQSDFRLSTWIVALAANAACSLVPGVWGRVG
jgi:hypothetical protein